MNETRFDSSLPQNSSFRYGTSCRLAGVHTSLPALCRLLYAPCVLLLCSLGAFAQDRLVPSQGTPASGKIVETGPEKIVIEVRGNKQEYKVQEVRKVVFDDEPAGLDRTRELVIQEQFDQALEEVKKLNVASITNPLAKQDYSFYRWYCEAKAGMSGAGDRAAAAAGLYAIYKVNPPTSHHFYTIAEVLGDLAIAQGKHDRAAPFFESLTKSGTAEVKAQGFYRLGDVELALGKTAEAKKRFQALANASATSSEMSRLKNYADVGLAICAAREGNAQSALTQLQSMVAKYDSTDHELFAKIYNAQGACNIALGQVNQAVIAYLHTDLLFFNNPEAHAESLYNLTLLWPKVNQPQRAQETRQRLTTQYASSLWANKK